MTDTFPDCMVLFVCKDGQKIESDRYNLAQCSPVFRKMLYGPMKEVNLKEIPIQEDSAVFKTFVQLLTPERRWQLNLAQIESLVELADKYDCSELLIWMGEWAATQFADPRILNAAVQAGWEGVIDSCVRYLTSCTTGGRSWIDKIRDPLAKRLIWVHTWRASNYSSSSFSSVCGLYPGNINPTLNNLH